MSSFADHLTHDARLVILRELSAQTDNRLNETLLTAVLDNFGHRRSREWVRVQLRYLADIGAIHITEAGSVMIAELRRGGQDHVERRIVLEGVARPSLGA
ncbi:VpaChn25_0724 family phage protein [Ensifer soli]|uniref:VpaChn25_0724 family phage protein n=1 Tax=Ciceribacter sp. sgz301302 TaxID=3342379 RepID=UPI0035BA2428